MRYASLLIPSFTGSARRVCKYFSKRFIVFVWLGGLVHKFKSNGFLEDFSKTYGQFSQKQTSKSCLYVVIIC